jgi:predicted DNA-binding transcriptional regulator YafY
MRRADRLFQIVQLLRRRRMMTAQQLAERLEVSERTIYRDIDDLSQSGVPIIGEAGVGYRLDPKFELPPLVFTAEEIEALVLGVRMVEGWADAGLRAAARSLLDKVDSVLPEGERHRISRTNMFALVFGPARSASKNLQELRRGVNEHRRVRISYQDGTGRATQRVIRPLGLYFWGRSWTVAAWCELREGYRSFRSDRITQLRVMKDKFELKSPYTLEDLIRAMAESEGRTP